MLLYLRGAARRLFLCLQRKREPLTYEVFSQ